MKKILSEVKSEENEYVFHEIASLEMRAEDIMKNSDFTQKDERYIDKK